MPGRLHSELLARGVNIFLRPKDGVYKLDGLINPATKRSIGETVKVFCTFDNNGKGKHNIFNANSLYLVQGGFSV